MRRLLAIVLLGIVPLASAKWARPNLNVPIDRLLKNLGAELAKNPKDAETNYLIGRLHSIAYAEAPPTVELYGTEAKPSFPHWATVKVHLANPNSAATKTQLEHLRQSLLYYHRAVELDPKNGLYRLGLAWMYEEAIPQAGRFGKLPWINPGPSVKDLRNLALAGYQRLYKDFLKQDLAGSHIMGVQDAFVSEDAGEGILRLNGHNLSATQRQEIRKNLDELKKKVSGITPIIFSLSGRRSLNALVNNQGKVGFDLMGDGYARTWPWVTQDAGILVWDPKMTGKITSGRQLFGGATFWMFFSDGYAALASLDDNRDGWLTGRELKGIAIWRDANLNGVSDPGEVLPAATHQVSGIRTKPSTSNGALAAEDGIKFEDGRLVPTYDWVPTSHPIPSGPRK